MPMSAGTSARPSAVRITRNGAIASGIVTSVRATSHGSDRTSAPTDGSSSAMTRRRDEQRPASLRADAHREGSLAHRAVGRDVTQVVHHEQRARQQTDRHREPEHARVEPVLLDERGAARGDEPEEDEHRDLAEPARRVRLRTTRVQRAAPRTDSGTGGDEPRCGEQGEDDAGNRARCPPSRRLQSRPREAARARMQQDASGPTRAAVSTPPTPSK